MQSVHARNEGPDQGPLATPPTLREAVIVRLRNDIVSGAIAPGALLRETALALKLGVSPTPVREALASLAAEGLVEIETHRLKRAAPIDMKAMHDLIQVQIELWRLGYLWGIPQVGAAERARMAAALDEYGAAVARDDLLSAIRAGHDFHTVVITASHNGELLRSTLDRLPLLARFVALRGRQTITRRGLREHQAILQAFTRGQPAEILDCYDRLSGRLRELAEQGLAESGLPAQI